MSRNSATRTRCCVAHAEMRERAAGLKVGSRALAAKDLRALEGGPGRRRAGEQAASVAEQKLGVGAEVGYQRQFVAQIGRLGERDAGRVGADVAGDAWQRIDIGAWREPEAACARRRFVSAVDRQRERRDAKLGRIEAEKQMMHDRIAGDRRL